MVLQTPRLILRPWEETDAVELYELAKDPRIGPAAGWPVHTSVENSRQIIREVLSAEEIYALVMKGGNAPVGSAGLMIGKNSDLHIGTHEAEAGYWIGTAFWGRGLAAEALRALMDRAFETLGLSALWCGYFDGNLQSKRVQEKCGFRFHHTEKNKKWPLTGEVKTQHITRITKKECSAGRPDGQRAGK